MTEIADYLDRPFTPVPADVREALRGGPIDPAGALSRDDLDRLLDPSPLPVEIGYCWLPDRIGYVAMRTRFPAGPPEMFEWWFDWHPREDVRYRIWHPRAHVSNRADRRKSVAEHTYWDVTNHPVEDIGTGVEHLRIEFMRPERYGYSAGAHQRPGVMAIVGGLVGDDRRRVRHTLMTHAFLDDAESDGYILRSRFYIGAVLEPYGPPPLSRAIGRSINRPAVRRRAIPRAAPERLAWHCAEEYNHLATILPELYAEFGPRPERAGV